MAPNNFGSALSKAALKGPLKGPLKGHLKAVIGRLQLISWTSCGVIKSKPRRRRRRRGAAAAEDAKSISEGKYPDISSGCQIELQTDAKLCPDRMSFRV